MPVLEYQGRRIESRPGETVLDACLRQGVDLHFSCRGGACHNCLCRSVDGAVPERAQRGIRPELAEKRYFLPCVCIPEGDLRFERPRAEDLSVRAVLQSREWLSADVCRIAIEPFTNFESRPGQSLEVCRDADRVRSFSIASHPDHGAWLELHVRRIPGGAVSPWLCDELAVGDELDIRGPHGHFVYAADPAQPLLFVASGTGLAPVLGVVRDALERGHCGPIHLYHGSRHADGLYLHGELRALSAAHPGLLHYHPCLSSLEVDRDRVLAGRAHEVAASRHSDLAGWRVHVAGPPAMVAAASALFLASGVSGADLVVDPFNAPIDRQDTTTIATHLPERASPPAQEMASPPPDPALWAALDEGARLMPILEEFYAEVFADPLLSPFFHGSTRQRAVEKVYSFLHQTISGKKVYFGDRPRNAHHWMTISNRLFDYREDMFFAVVSRHGVPEPMIARWRAMQERYRSEIVKSEPWPRMMDGVALPLEGFGTMVIDVGSVCDGCAGEIHRGETVRYHLRLGSTYCSACADDVSRDVTCSA
ncbi:2Fe-2S iron-sulfur cluster-binding protein [Lysobacter hankyongensis]|uniref:2Fe-2S iron-sulfur cluster binding domain-containing protein n=1 Tax=Lysobacter hankyongensis TaxID=1176535 RepID=A0ABP9AXV6_9GAMM